MKEAKNSASGLHQIASKYLLKNVIVIILNLVAMKQEYSITIIVQGAKIF
jgi:hypothetical protein